MKTLLLFATCTLSVLHIYGEETTPPTPSANACPTSPSTDTPKTHPVTDRGPEGSVINTPSNTPKPDNSDPQKKGSTTVARPPLIPASEGAIGSPDDARRVRQSSTTPPSENAKPK